MNKTLHIVNGDCFAEVLRQSSIAGEVLAWRESLIDGPICYDVYHSESVLQRAAYFEDNLGVPQSLFIEGSLQQLHKLAELADYDEVVLWFEYDLYDQAMLLSILSWIARSKQFLPTIHLMELDSFPGVDLFHGFGQLTPEQASSLVGLWRQLDHSHLQWADRVWRAFAGSDPRELIPFLQSAELQQAFPLLKPALTYHLTRLPAVGNGLSLLEYDILQWLAMERIAPPSLFKKIAQDHRMYGLGDLSFWSYIDRLAHAEVPLVEMVNDQGNSLVVERLASWIDTGKACLLQLTSAGNRVLARRLDYGPVRKRVRWIGGVSHSGAAPNWRRNPVDGPESIILE